MTGSRTVDSERPTVHVVDDDAAVRDSVALLLRLRGYTPVCHASGEAFLASADPALRGCVLLDLRMTGLTGLDVQAELARRGIEVPVIVLTAHGDAATARAALKAGAFDFLEKPFDPTTLLDLIGSALALDASRRERDRERRALQQRLERLTGREREVFDLVVAGRHNREIAEALGISPRTVEVYKARLMDKLGVDRLADLIRLSVATLEAGSAQPEPRGPSSPGENRSGPRGRT